MVKMLVNDRLNGTVAVKNLNGGVEFTISMKKYTSKDSIYL